MAPAEAKAKSSSKDKERKEKTDKVGMFARQEKRIEMVVGPHAVWQLPQLAAAARCGGATSLGLMKLRAAAQAQTRLLKQSLPLYKCCPAPVPGGGPRASWRLASFWLLPCMLIGLADCSAAGQEGEEGEEGQGGEGAEGQEGEERQEGQGWVLG